MDDYSDIRDDWAGGAEPLKAEGSLEEIDILPHYLIQQSRMLSLQHAQRLKAQCLVLTSFQKYTLATGLISNICNRTDVLGMLTVETC